MDSSKMDEDGKDYTVYTSPLQKHDPIMKLSLSMVKTTSDGCNFVVIWRGFTVSCDVSPTPFSPAVSDSYGGSVTLSSVNYPKVKLCISYDSSDQELVVMVRHVRNLVSCTLIY